MSIGYFNLIGRLLIKVNGRSLIISLKVFPINSSCQQSSVVDEETKGYAFIIKKYTYDCDATIKSPDTGVNNYYLVLGILIGVFTIVLSIINKKNAFKRFEY